MDARELAGIPLFDDLKHKERERIAHFADVIDLPAGAHLLDQGAFAHEFYVILDGTVAVGRDGQHLADLGRGDFFGEIAMLDDDHRRTASCTATTDVRVAVMATREFNEMRSTMPDIADRLEAAARARMS